MGFIFKIPLLHTQHYLPTKRHRKARTQTIPEPVEYTIPVLTKEQFPAAFIVTDLQSVYEGARNYMEFDDEHPNDYKMHSEELRTYNGKLFRPVRVTHGAAISTVFEYPLSYIPKTVRHRVNRSHYPECCEDTFSKQSIILDDDLPEQMEALGKETARYVIFDWKVYEECGEPMYMVNTFGLGHNHGGTGFFVEYSYNSNISKDNYFNALQREEALEYAKETALGRGDTESVPGLGKFEDIQVLMPEMVKRDPQKEHGDGDPFLNGLKNATRHAGSIQEAGIMAALYTAVEAYKEAQ